jgi:ABC-type molybdenum transport system ATPase subunit/photorepair protein PhrA
VGVFGDAGPLGPTVFKFEPGLTAIYGLNGAGKTRLLKAIGATASPWGWCDDRSAVGRSDRGALLAYFEQPQDADFHPVYRATNPRGRDGPPEVYVDVLPVTNDRDLALEAIEKGRFGIMVAPTVGGLRQPQLLIGEPIESVSPRMRAWLREQTLRLLDGEDLAYHDHEDPEDTIGHFEGRPISDIAVTLADWTVLHGPCTGLLWSELLRIVHGVTVPAWWPDPIASLGPIEPWTRLPGDYDDRRLEQVSLFEVLEESRPVDLVQETVGYLRRKPGYSGATGSLLDAKGQLTDEVLASVAQLESRASAVLSALLGTGLELECVVREPDHWADSPPLAWLAKIRDHRVHLSELSQAQQRWSEFAIRWSLIGHPDLVVIDEPEAGLHRAAEANLFGGLKGLAASTGVSIIVATHSPQALRDEDIRLVHLADRVASVDDGSIRRTASELGLDPADMLQMTRRFVLVEGRHDEIVLESLIGTELRRLRAAVLPTRGGRNLPAHADAAIIFDFTTAPIIAVLDNLCDSALVASVVDELRTTPEADIEVVIGQLDALPASSERRFLREFLGKAARRNRLDRVATWGFSKKDVIEYLDMRTLVPTAAAKNQDWDALRRVFETATSSSKNPPDFKKWLANNYDADFGDESLRRAAEALDEIHPDFIDLLNAVSAS